MQASDMQLDVVRAETQGDEVLCFVAIDGGEVWGHIAVGPDGKASIYGLGSVDALFADRDAAAHFDGAAYIEDMRERLLAVHAAGGTRVPLEVVKFDRDERPPFFQLGPPGSNDPEDWAAFTSGEWNLAKRVLRDAGLLTGLDFWTDCPAIERDGIGQLVFEGTPIPLAALFTVLANDATAANFLDVVPRHFADEQVDAVLTWLIKQCGGDGGQDGPDELGPVQIMRERRARKRGDE